MYFVCFRDLRVPNPFCLLSPGSPLRAAPKPALLAGPTYVSGIIDTDATAELPWCRSLLLPDRIGWVADKQYVCYLTLQLVNATIVDDD